MPAAFGQKVYRDFVLKAPEPFFSGRDAENRARAQKVEKG